MTKKQFINRILSIHILFLLLLPRPNAQQTDSAENNSQVNLLNEKAHELQFLNTDSAYTFAIAALKLAVKLDYDVGVADAKTTLGVLCSNQGKYDEGVKITNDALTLYNKILSRLSKNSRVVKTQEEISLLLKIANAYNVITQNLFPQGNYSEALKTALAALKIREKYGVKKGIADAEFNVGLIYYCQFNYREALEHYSRCLKVCKEMGDSVFISATYNAMAVVYFDQGNNDEALKNFTTALKIGEKTNDKLNLAEIYTHIGPLEERLGNYDKALKHAFAALEIYEELGNNFQLGFLYNNIASVYIKQNKYNIANEYLNKALSASKEAGHLEYLKLTYMNWSKLDSLKGDYKRSLDHYKDYITVRDSLLNKENTRKITETQMQYVFDKQQDSLKSIQDKKDVVAQQKASRQRNIRNTTFAGLVLVILFSLVVLRQRNKVKKEKKRSDGLLLNILPAETAEELKATGSAIPKDFEQVTVLFTDFKDFTQASEKMTAHQLVNEINIHFCEFDRIISKYNIEKIKTIGDSYMAAGGLPVPNNTNVEDTVRAALEIQSYMQKQKEIKSKTGETFFEIRIGIHTGPVVAGIVGIKKFAYDIWGDTVNIASRMESSCEVGKINISGTTYKLVKDKFNCTYRGKINAKHKGEIDMYFVER